MGKLAARWIRTRFCSRDRSRQADGQHDLGSSSISTTRQRIGMPEAVGSR
jgi:hypothetical protein